MANDKVTVKLLRPVDGKAAGDSAEYDRADVQALVDYGAVSASGFEPSENSYGIVHNNMPDDANTIFDEGNGAAVSKDILSVRAEPATKNKMAVATDNKAADVAAVRKGK